MASRMDMGPTDEKGLPRVIAVVSGSIAVPLK